MIRYSEPRINFPASHPARIPMMIVPSISGSFSESSFDDRSSPRLRFQANGRSSVPPLEVAVLQMLVMSIYKFEEPAGETVPLLKVAGPLPRPAEFVERPVRLLAVSQLLSSHPIRFNV